jgi:D-glycero-D-manno-heptose 1,7-bisphosphate phosphatase
MRPRLIIFDADGTLRRTLVPGQPCPHASHEWALLEGVQARVSALPAGTLLGVASNQDHVGYGLLSYADAHEMLVQALEVASGRKADPNAVKLCPHRLDVVCDCRKPAPGMLLDILRYFRVSEPEALFVGNETIDCEAANRAGVPFLWAADFFASR